MHPLAKTFSYVATIENTRTLQQWEAYSLFFCHNHDQKMLNYLYLSNISFIGFSMTSREMSIFSE